LKEVVIVKSNAKVGGEYIETAPGEYVTVAAGNGTYIWDGRNMILKGDLEAARDVDC
jgi:hypothetical protein